MKLRLVSFVLVWCLHSVDSLQCPECRQRKKEYDDAWEKFKDDYKKDYGTCFKECKRRVIWERNCEYVEQFNSGSLYRDSSDGNSLRIGVNQFSDWTDTEKARKLNGLVVPRIVVTNEEEKTGPPILSLPTSINYTDMGYVTPVKDQGACGNCWAHSAAGAMEGQLRKVCGELIEVSIQDLNDCCNNGTAYGCYGCQGGWMNGAFRCTKSIGGIVTSILHSLNRTDQMCTLPLRNQTQYLCDSYQTIAAYNEADMMNQLVMGGPLSCAFDTNGLNFYSYKSGIFNDTSCPRNVNHAVLITGYGTTPEGADYWIIKNSWGGNWGENGYFRLTRGYNLCDIAHYCSYPLNCIPVFVP